MRGAASYRGKNSQRGADALSEHRPDGGGETPIPAWDGSDTASVGHGRHFEAGAAYFQAPRAYLR